VSIISRWLHSPHALACRSGSVVKKVRITNDDSNKVYDQGLSRAAIILECEGGTVKRYADAGKLPHIRDSSGKRLFAIADLRAFKRNNRIGNQRRDTSAAQRVQ
jgi:hypothetical protein